MHQHKVADFMVAAGSVLLAQGPLNRFLLATDYPAALNPLYAMGAAIPLPEEEGGEGEGASSEASRSKGSQAKERAGLFWVPERSCTTPATSACVLIILAYTRGPEDTRRDARLLH